MAGRGDNIGSVFYTSVPIGDLKLGLLRLIRPPIDRYTRAEHETAGAQAFDDADGDAAMLSLR